jgi:hypothetical protein
MFAPAIVFVDLETTGTTPTGDRITEIGIVRVDDGEFVDEWSTLVNPECSIPEEIQALTGITNEMVRGKPTFPEVRREVLERLEGRVFVDHHARLDYGFLKHEFRRTGSHAGITFIAPFAPALPQAEPPPRTPSAPGRCARTRSRRKSSARTGRPGRFKRRAPCRYVQFYRAARYRRSQPPGRRHPQGSRPRRSAAR